MDKRYTPERITELKANEIFVFGSNLAGAHAGGAARIAMEKFGAVWGQGVGNYVDMHEDPYDLENPESEVRSARISKKPADLRPIIKKFKEDINKKMRNNMNINPFKGVDITKYIK